MDMDDPAPGPARADRYHDTGAMRRAALLLVLAVLCGSACAQPVVNVYSSMAEKDLRRLAAEFESRHAIKVNLWRSGKNRIQIGRAHV